MKVKDLISVLSTMDKDSEIRIINSEESSHYLIRDFWVDYIKVENKNIYFLNPMEDIFRYNNVHSPMEDNYISIS